MYMRDEYLYAFELTNIIYAGCSKKLFDVEKREIEGRNKE